MQSATGLPVDMLSAADSPSSRPAVCSRGCGLRPPGPGGCGGGRLGLWRGGLGVGRDLGSVPVSGGGDESEGVVAVWLCPGEVRAEPPCG